MNKELLREIFVSALTRHTAQAIGGAVTAIGAKDVLLDNGATPEGIAAVLVGVGVQSAAFYWSAWRKRRRAKKAAQNQGAK